MLGMFVGVVTLSIDVKFVTLSNDVTFSKINWETNKINIHDIIVM